MNVLQQQQLSVGRPVPQGSAVQVYQHTTAAAAIISGQTSKFHDHDCSCGLYLIFTLHVLARLGKYVIVIHITIKYCLRGLNFIIKGSFF